MIDIHNHLLYGIDDGSKTIEESIEVLKDLEKSEFTDIILTPHYIYGSKYNNDRENNLERLNILKQELKNNNISINLYLGNEIYIDENIANLLKENIISCMSNTKFILVELPLSGEFVGYQEIIKDLIIKGYRVILAHPERYLTFQDDYELLNELRHMGVLFQCNLESLTGKYGPYAERMIIRMLKEGKASFLATDIHHKKHDPNGFEKAKKVALKYVTKEAYRILTEVNPNHIIG